MSASVRREAMKLETDPLVELWELDTTALLNILGVGGQGSVYRWTPGVLNYRMDGLIGSNASTSTIIVLDRVLSVPNSAVKWNLQVSNPDGTDFTPPVRVAGWLTQTVGASSYSIVGLVSPIAVPVQGARWLMETVGSVFSGGVEYRPAPIEFTDMEWSGKGALPRPKLRVSNIGGLAAALVIQFGDIVGATVTRRITFKSFLDGEATPDPSAVFEPEIFVVDRKSHHDKTSIEFELASILDQQGIMLPRRVVMRDHCDHTYRQWTTLGTGFLHFVQGTCPYTDTVRFFKENGDFTPDPALDVCGKKISDCILRFGANSVLPFRGFPGVAETQS